MKIRTTAARVIRIKLIKPSMLEVGDTFHGTYPALATKGMALIPILNSSELDAMTAHWEFAFSPSVFNQRVVELNYRLIQA
jgi:S-sulfosulfanyl-L-cysteine sulfohydrolase